MLNESHDIEVTEVPDPTPGPEELVLRVTACGICGSDLKARPHFPTGLVMGHEFCGEIVAAGKDAGERWRIGQQVASLPVIGCGSCAVCLAGEPAHCNAADLIGVGGSPGGFAEFVRVSTRETFALPEGLEPALGALTEPLAVGLHAVDRARLNPGDSVLVVGAGPVGLAVIVWARHLGAGEIVVSDPSPERRGAAGGFGASRVVDPTTEEIGGGYDVVFECVGLPGMIEAAVGAARLHGKVIVAGVCMQPDTLVPAVALMKELTMDFIVYYTRREFGYVVDALGRGTIDPRPFVTERVGLEGVNDAFRELTQSKAQRKVLVLPG